MRIDARGLHYQELNQQVRRAVESGEKEIVLDNVNGQRYIGAGLRVQANIIINGVPGNDLASFMDGPHIVVHGNGQDLIGNTMNSGKVVVHGDAGDVIGHSMRGGKIFIKGNVGYRVGIHMKSYQDLFPVIVAGGIARDFLGEYMAGGVLVLLGLDREKGPLAENIVGNYVGTGMHGGTIYIRGQLEDYQLGKEVGRQKLAQEDWEELEAYLKEFCKEFSLDLEEILQQEFTKFVPYSHRPYGKIYAY